MISDDIWERLKDCKHVEADGVFFCKHSDGRKVIVLYNEKEKTYMTCGLQDDESCTLDYQDKFTERH